MNQLKPPSIQIGIFPAFIAKQTETLVLRGHYVGGSYDVGTIDGQQLLQSKQKALHFRIESMYMTCMAHICVPSEEKRGQFLTHYYAETPSGDKHILYIDSKMGLGGSKNTVTFTNVVDGSPAAFFFKKNAWGTHGEVLNNATGQIVAVIDREMFKIRNEYHVTVPLGIDMVVILAICIAMDDKARSAQAGAAGASAGSAAGGGGGA